MFDGHIRDHAIWSPRAPAMLLSGRDISYAELDADVDRLATALAAQGVGRATGVVAVAVRRPYLACALTAALSRIDTVSAPANDSAADLRLTDMDAPEAARGGGHELRLTEAWLAQVLSSERQRRPARLAASGAVGRVMPSAGGRVPLTWGQLNQDAHAVLRQIARGRAGAWAPVCGLESQLGLALLMGGWGAGAAIINTQESADVAGWLERTDTGIVAMTPAQLAAVISSLPPGFRPRPGWRIVCTGFAPPRRVAEAVRLQITPDVLLHFGMAETGTIALGDAAGLDDDPMLIGITPAEIQVEPAGPGERSEVRVRSPRTEAGGDVSTGLAGRRLADGRLALDGQLADRLDLRDGAVFPAPIEAAAMDCPGVLDTAAFAATGADGALEAWLAVVAAPDVLRETLVAHLEAAPGLPALRMAWAEAIPRDAQGRPDRAALRAAVEAATIRG